MRRFSDAHRVFAVTALAFTVTLSSCGRKDEPEPTPADPALRTTTTTPKNLQKGAATPAPDDSAARVLPAASRDPDMGLDPADPAKDYVTRYLKATKRYGDKATCVVVKASKFTGDRSVVETHNDASGICGKADELRDRFFVTVATDRMSLDDSLHQAKLEKWPDGSDPDAPASKVMDLQDLRTWKSGLRDTFHKLELAPLRVQLYGRGTYPVISIAGWHGPVLRNMTPGQLEAPAKTLCEANEGSPLGIFAAMDRSTLLRIQCPGSAKFESL